jgi:ferredoxin, 2Fe-2S
MQHINVIDEKGVMHQLEALEGWRIMEIIRDWGLPMKAICGGACECASCHVHVSPEWVAQVPLMQHEERDKLDELPEINKFSRLSCQILYSEALKGLTVTLTPDCLE